MSFDQNTNKTSIKIANQRKLSHIAQLEVPEQSNIVVTDYTENDKFSTNNKQNKSNIQEIISDSRRMVSEDFEYPQRSGQASFSRK